MRKSQQASRSNASSAIPPGTKPLCDCIHCGNKKCPNVLDMVPIALANSSGVRKRNIRPFQLNKPKKKKKKPPPPLPPARPSLLDMLNERDCACELMAHALESHIHMNMGMAARRDRINSGCESDNESTDAPTDPTVPTPSNDVQK